VAEGDHQDAIADFSTVIRLKPTYASGYTMRGGAYEMAGEKHRAIADFRIALALDPSLETVKSAIRRLGGAV
jgi:Flp pilus assembly protein TadD